MSSARVQHPSNEPPLVGFKGLYMLCAHIYHIVCRLSQDPIHKCCVHLIACISSPIMQTRFEYCW